MSISIIVRASGLKQKRVERGLTQRELAKRLAVTQNYIAAIEADDRRPGPDLRRKMMDELDATFDDLFEVMRVDESDGSEVALQPAPDAGRGRQVG